MTKLYDGRWRYIRNVGSGGQGSVVVVIDATGAIDGELALKRLTNVDSWERRLRFERETNALSVLDHPNILKIHAKQLAPDGREKPFFVAEYCSHGSLSDLDVSSFVDDISKAAQVLLPIVGALEQSHKQGIVHRDIKPANILFRGDDTPVLGDFGICYVQDGAVVTLTDEGVGSKNFIAPEMESGAMGDPSEATDVYSLAKVLYWLVSGGREFARENHRGGTNNLAPSATRQRFHHVHMFLDKFLQTDPSKRKGLGDFRRSLQELVFLVKEDYVPLLPDLKITCRFCGLGTYQRSRNRSGFPVPEAGIHGAAGSYVVAMWCDHCGHIESFNLRASSYREWWNGKSDL